VGCYRVGEVKRKIEKKSSIKRRRNCSPGVSWKREKGGSKTWGERKKGRIVDHIEGSRLKS